MAIESNYGICVGAPKRILSINGKSGIEDCKNQQSRDLNIWEASEPNIPKWTEIQ